MKAFGRKIYAGMIKGRKIISILFVTVFIILFGFQYVPFEQKASATIFDDVMWHVRQVPEYFSQVAPGHDPVRVTINGGDVFYATSKSHHQITDILDYYETMYRVDPEIFLKHPLFENDEAYRKTERFVRLSTDRKVRVESDTWGFFATLTNVAGGWENGMYENFSTFIQAARRMLETGRVSELGDPKAVVVFREKDQSKSLILRSWMDSNFNIKNFTPDADGDFPGEDIVDMPRYPGSKRIISMGVPMGDKFNSLNVYRNPDRALGAALYYRTELPKYGWQIAEPFDQAMLKENNRTTLYFSRPNEECWVSLHEKDNYTYHTLMFRDFSS